MDELRRIRKERGLSQQRLAELANVDKVTIVHIEGGKVSPKVETLEKLAEALGVELGDFFPKAQMELPLDFDPEEVESIPELKRAAALLWARYRQLAAYEGVRLSNEDVEQALEIGRRLDVISNRIKDLSPPPLATISQHEGERARITYHREPTSEERARLRAEYPDAEEVEDLEAVLVW